MDAHPEFVASLELMYPGRVEVLQQFNFSSAPEDAPSCTDQVIGVWNTDKAFLKPNRKPLFKEGRSS
jgi:hypothetical protein